MTTAFRMNLDGTDAIRYFHVPIAWFYLEIAREHAASAKGQTDDHRALKDSIVAIALAVMSIEALINQIAEEILLESELDDFIRLRRQYGKDTTRSSSIKKKLTILVGRRSTSGIPPDLLDRLEALVSLRNELVHYKLADTAGKIMMPAFAPRFLPNEGFMVSADFTTEPVAIEPPLIQKITPDAAVRASDVALEVFRLWCDLEGAAAQLAEIHPLASTC